MQRTTREKERKSNYLEILPLREKFNEIHCVRVAIMLKQIRIFSSLPLF